MTTSSVPLSAIVGFTKNLRVFDSLGRSEMASCFLPAERSAVGSTAGSMAGNAIYDSMTKDDEPKQPAQAQPQVIYVPVDQNGKPVKQAQ